MAHWSFLVDPLRHLLARSRFVDAVALQDRFAPNSRCFGCGPANERGLRIKSYPDGDELVATWMPEPHHEAFEGALNGGIIGSLLDCHSNWTAAYHLMTSHGLNSLPSTVTAAYSVKMLRPTPTREGPISLRARVVEAAEDRATVDASLEAGGRVCATSRATFVVVKPGHPGYGRW